ncbi:unnamed protein product [Brassica rapa]|uniref:Uncharacterized protein n=1 Tax=Brassica campestris TaxID=3711 RepID=A0A8D9D179_BRACM|nr:unnamed protein product [Brassica rapa]
MEIEDRVSQFHCTIPLGPPITHLDAAYLYPFSKTRLQVSSRVLQLMKYNTKVTWLPLCICLVEGNFQKPEKEVYFSNSILNFVVQKEYLFSYMLFISLLCKIKHTKSVIISLTFKNSKKEIYHFDSAIFYISLFRYCNLDL